MKVDVTSPSGTKAGSAELPDELFGITPNVAVLHQVITAQLAKGLGATEAACLAAYVHGLAADLAAQDALGTEGMVAGDLLMYLPAAIELVKSGDEEDHEHD